MVAGFLVRSQSVCGGKSFGTPGMLDFLHLRRFDPADRAALRDLGHSAARHTKRPSARQDIAALEQRIDQLAAEIWGLPPSDLDAIGGEGTKDEG